MKITNSKCLANPGSPQPPPVSYRLQSLKGVCSPVWRTVLACSFSHPLHSPVQQSIINDQIEDLATETPKGSVKRQWGVFIEKQNNITRVGFSGAPCSTTRGYQLSWSSPVSLSSFSSQVMPRELTCPLLEL